MKRSIIFIVLLIVFISISYSGPKLAFTHFPPYFYGDNSGEPATGGLGVYIINHIFDKIEMDYSIHLYEFEYTLELAKMGKIDAIVFLLKTSERKEYLEYTDIIFEDKDVIWYNSDYDKGINQKDLKALKGMRAGIVQGYTYGDAFNPQDFQLFEFQDERSNFHALSSNRIDFLLASISNGTYLINKEGLENLDYNKEPVSFYSRYIAFSKKSDYIYLIPEINQILKDYNNTFEYILKNNTIGSSSEIQLLKNNDVFRELKDGEFEILLSQLNRKTYERGELIIPRNDKTRELFILISGKAGAFMEEKKLIADAESGTFFGTLTFLDGLPGAFDIYAMDDIIAYTIDMDTFDFIIKDTPRIALQILRNLSEIVSLRLRNQYILNTNDGLIESAL